MTLDSTLVNRADAILNQVCSFEDWNPTHYLDVAEMCMAVSITYDWMFDALSEQTKQTVREAIVRLALDESYKGYEWHNKYNNWNAVCNAGMIAGALAVSEYYPEMAKDVISRSVNNARGHVLTSYQPDGNYPEGYTYWIFGSTYLTMLQDMLEKAIGYDFGLAKDHGFMRSGEFMLHMTTQGMGSFRFSDSMNPTDVCLAPLYWMASQKESSSLFYRERERIQYWKDKGNYPKMFSARFLPVLMLWAPKDLYAHHANQPEETMFVGHGITPVALMRNHWGGSDEMFLAIKGGILGFNHTHMDLGSFAFQTGECNWFTDLSPQGYHTVEQHGIVISDYKNQYSKRWSVTRNGPYLHNIIIIADSLQRVDKKADIIASSNTSRKKSATVDLTGIEGGLVKKYLREAAIIDNGKSAYIMDELVGGEQDQTMRWAALTPAHIQIVKPNEAILTMKGKSLKVVFEGEDINLETFSAEPRNYFDFPNPGVELLGFRSTLKAGKKRIFKITFENV